MPFMSSRPSSPTYVPVYAPTAHRPLLRANTTPSLRVSTFATNPLHRTLRPQIYVSPSPQPQCTQATYRPSVNAVSTTPSILTIISTIIGVCVLIGSVLYKIPQVIRVVRRRSASGISVLMYSLETLGTTFSAVYFARRAFPFATYGEAVFIMAQNVLILGLIVYYQRLPTRAAGLLALAYAVMLVLLYSSLVPLRVLMVLQVCSIPILNLARVPQILLNWRRRSTGELSPVTLGLQLLGNIARIFTTIAQVRDFLMFAAICVATLFNTVLFLQWVFYSRNTTKLDKMAGQLPNA